MNNEKVLSNEELLNIAGGSSFLPQTQKNKIDIIHRPLCKYGIPGSFPSNP